MYRGKNVRGGGFQSIKIALKYDLNYDACKVQSGTPTIGVKHCTKVQSGTPNFSVKHLVYFGNKIEDPLLTFFFSKNVCPSVGKQ